MLEIQENIPYKLQTKDGPICGYIEKTNNKTYYKFKKIPYAKSPVESLRFMPPVPIKPWTVELDCTQDASHPLSVWDNEIIGSEDCLYIEVCAPKICTDELLPVMFWVGSFGFFYYMNPSLDPNLLVDQNVVFVTCGFRLGPFGFLSINEFIAPGNNGLKDIIMALHWVQRNIKCFGGDPSNVTLIGSSSGGSIVHYMMLSPMATGLFHKALIQSASAMNNWSLEKNPVQVVLKLAKVLGISNTDRMEIVKELKKIPGMKLAETCLKLFNDEEFKSLNMFDAVFKPCIEKEFEGVPVFLSKSPALILKSGAINKVPLIIGGNNCEASMFEYINDDFYNNYERINEQLFLMVPKSLAENMISKDVSRKILNFYLNGEESFRSDTKHQYVQLMTDYCFLYHINKSVMIHKQIAPECPIYYYIINYIGDWTVPEPLEFFNSSGHAAEIPLIFDVILPDGSVCKGGRDSMIVRKMVIKMWTNFAKYGNPTPDENDQLLKIKWDPVTSKEELNYLCISPNLTKGVNPFQDRMSFWEDLHKEHKFLRILAHFNDIGVFS